MGKEVNVTDHFLQSCDCGKFLPDTAALDYEARYQCPDCGTTYTVGQPQELHRCLLRFTVDPSFWSGAVDKVPEPRHNQPVGPEYSTASIRAWVKHE